MLVWYTDFEATPGEILDTRELCDRNFQELARAAAVDRAVERLLEEIRRTEYPEAPDRVCSIIVVPWPRSRVEKVYATRHVRFPVPELPGYGARCYRLAPTAGSRRWMADETIVEGLRRDWAGLSKDREAARERARDYWEGRLGGGLHYLFQGPVRVEEECPDPRFLERPLRWEAD